MPPPTVEELADGVRAGRRAAIARAITLVESRRPDHAGQAQALLAELLPDTGGAERIGISGVPGVGKSTFIEALGPVPLDHIPDAERDLVLGDLRGSLHVDR